MSKRKANNMHSRMQRAKSAILRQNHVALVHVAPEAQTLIHLRNLKRITATKILIDALADYQHQWTVFFAGLCTLPDGSHYIAGCVEATLLEPRKLDLLYEWVDEQQDAALKACNQNHVVGAGFIAVPFEAELDEPLALELFERAGAWNKEP